MKNKGLVAMCLITLFWNSSANANAIFDWVCSEATCGGDTALYVSIEFTDSVLSPNNVFTGGGGNFVSYSVTSSAGNGYSISGTNVAFDDLADITFTLNAFANEIISIVDSVGSYFELSDGVNGNFFIAEGGAPFTATSRDAIPAIDDLNVGTGRLLLRSVPEPASVALMGLGLAGIGFSRRHSKKAA